MTSNAHQVLQFLSGHEVPLSTLRFLSHQFFPTIVTHLNKLISRRSIALYSGDRVPENERNLTDVRNRIGLLLEYKLALAGNSGIEDHGINNLFLSHVVANRFPDLEIRNSAGHRGIRVEVKCLQAISEEKSANFDTLKKDLNPNTDYVAVLIWEWKDDDRGAGWDRAPIVLRAFVFHASSLAELRDYNWLRTPPNDLGDGLQGFDIRYAVNCRQGTYNEEEGNYGKLMRIWNPSTNYSPGLGNILATTV